MGGFVGLLAGGRVERWVGVGDWVGRSVGALVGGGKFGEKFGRFEDGDPSFSGCLECL